MAKTKEVSQKDIKEIFDNEGVTDFLQYLKSPWRIFWSNFLAGISRGFGIVIGMSVVLGLAIWIIAQMVNLPLVGEYFEKAQSYINQYVEQTNYTSEFNQMNQSLVEIKDLLKK